MQTTTPGFGMLASGNVRPLSYGTSVSFDRMLDTSITFFTLDVSLLDGTDILAPGDDNPIQEWDKYLYTRYDDRVISIEVSREETNPYSIARAFADIKFNNYDGYFTPSSGSPVSDYILPRRPFKAYLGFGGETLQQIVGLSEGMPELDKDSRTCSFHVIDFMSFMFDKDIGESVILENVKTHEVLDYLFQLIGLVPSQYVLDTSFNTISFFYVEKGTKLGTVASQLMEAEIGRLYLDEQGIIRFRNRYNYDLTPVLHLNDTNVIDYSISSDSLIINSVKITSEVRKVQDLQSVWTLSEEVQIDSGQTATIWANFSDPITSLLNPSYSSVEASTSYYISSNTDVDLVSVDVFSKTAKLVFENTGSSPATISTIDIYGTPAKVVDTIKVEEVDEDSIDKFDEQVFEIDNPYIQSADNALSRALILLNNYKDFASVLDVEIKGSPALQLGDALTLDVDGYSGIYVISKITNILSDSKFTQRLTVAKRVINSFFILDQSLLNGTDVLSP